MQTSSLRCALAFSIVLVMGLLLGAYAGMRYEESKAVGRGMEQALATAALNLEAIKFMRDGKTADAVSLLNALNETHLVYLMRYDDTKSGDAKFQERKTTVLALLRKERMNGGGGLGTTEGMQSDPEWKEYQRSLDDYLMRNSK